MSQGLSRRAFARAFTSLAMLATVEPLALAEKDVQKKILPTNAFPAGFSWGTASAAYQVEGAVTQDGRGQSIWDVFSHSAGKTSNGDTGDIAADEFHRHKLDVELMKSLGVSSYRFSIAWPRVFPNGGGAPNSSGLDFYDRLIDELLAAGITPFCTLYHWDLPQELQLRGGWSNPETAKLLAEYAGYVTRRISDRVANFITMNEIRTFVELGYKEGIHAPGLKLDARQVAQLSHNALLGHGLSVQAIRANGKSGTKVGLAENVIATTPVLDSPEHVAAVRRAMREENAMYLTAIMEGQYTDAYLTRIGADAPRFTPQEMSIIGSPVDFVGLNIYQPTYIQADSNPAGYSIVNTSPTFPHMLSPWLTVGPECMYWAPKLVSEQWKVKSLYITENGASAADVVTSTGQVLDIDRVMYLRNYLSQLQRVISEGVPVKGYFLWSLLDNYEWADGYGKRFGLVYVDFNSQERLPKLSAQFYRNLIRKNSIS